MAAASADWPKETLAEQVSIMPVVRARMIRGAIMRSCLRILEIIEVCVCAAARKGLGRRRESNDPSGRARQD